MLYEDRLKKELAEAYENLDKECSHKNHKKVFVIENKLKGFI